MKNCIKTNVGDVVGGGLQRELIGEVDTMDFSEVVGGELVPSPVLYSCTMPV
jgi:hypothetical protein